LLPLSESHLETLSVVFDTLSVVVEAT